MSDWPPAGQRQRVAIPGPAGALDALIEAAEQPARALAVLCHPHPQHGGSKDNKVVFTAARAARAAGCDSLRFDFRGVGASAGVYGALDGEVEDALAVVRWGLEAGNPDRVFLLGFSFGAAVALRAAQATRCGGLVTIALPSDYFATLPRPDCPWLAVHGTADEVADAQAAAKALRGLQPPPQLKTLDGAGHFFHGRLSELGGAITPCLAAWLAD